MNFFLSGINYPFPSFNSTLLWFKCLLPSIQLNCFDSNFKLCISLNIFICSIPLAILIGSGIHNDQIRFSKHNLKRFAENSQFGTHPLAYEREYIKPYLFLSLHVATIEKSALTDRMTSPAHHGIGPSEKSHRAIDLEP